MCRGRPPAPPPLPEPRPTPPPPEPTARRVVTGDQRTASLTRRRTADEARRRTNRLGTLRRLGTKSLRIPLLNISDLNNPL